MKRRFVWDVWDFDLDGEAYIIAKDACPDRENVVDFICREDGIPEKHKSEMYVQEGWCRWEVRRGWDNLDGEPRGGYCVYNTKAPRSFAVWIIRRGEW
nr:MAG TPA: hypothetical protein [Caudoviricetes sp.]